ncbi:MAG: glycosyl transferase, partial [Sulfobacillus thermosulfidooxidans]
MVAVRVVFAAFLVMTLGLMGFLENWRSKIGWSLAVVFGVIAFEPALVAPIGRLLRNHNLTIIDGVAILLVLMVVLLFGALRAANGKSAKSLNIINQLVDEQAFDDFDKDYGAVQFNPITVVIPAYYEAANIGKVLESIPRMVHNTAVSVLVVVDGSPDGTDKIVKEHGDFASYVRVNRGQGAALRVGYHLAIEHGAQYIVTLDADGQYDPEEMRDLVEPVLNDEADYVQGSRRMGNYVTDDMIRVLGVYWFNWLIGILIKQKITDSSNGFRAIKAQVLKDLSLSEDQYHAAELLILSMRKNYRVIERPA